MPCDAGILVRDPADRVRGGGLQRCSDTVTVETRECMRGIQALHVGLLLLLGQPSEVGMITVFVIDVRFRNTKAFFSYYENAFVLCNRSGHGACAAPENKLARTVNHWHTLERTSWLSGPLSMLELASESTASALAAAAAGPARGAGDSTPADAHPTRLCATK